jgi:hypothetical protein
MTKLIGFDGRLCSPLGIIPNLPIEFGGKTILINVAIMNGLMDYKILLPCDFIYVINFVVSSLFRVIIFPNVEHIITIDQLSYTDPPPPHDS